MAGRLHLAPPGADKTAEMLKQLRRVTASRWDLPRIWVLLTSRQQERNFRQRLIDDDTADSVHFNIEFFDFARLHARLLKMASMPLRRLNAAARYGLLRRLLHDMLAAEELRVFHGIADTRGFLTVLARHFDELKQSGVRALSYAAAAQSAKDHELATIYTRYQSLLKDKRLADSAGEGWLALETVQQQPDLVAGCALMLVDGFEQFTRVRAHLLAAMASAIPQLHITLTATNDMGLPRRSAITRRRLEEAFAAASVPLRIVQIDAHSQSHADLQGLSRAIFSDEPASEHSSVLHMIAMPSPAKEVRAVLRVVKRRLLDGARPDDILIVLRGPQHYAKALTAAGREFGLPLLVHAEAPASATPVIASLLDLLGLAPRFRRRDLLDALRSPYIQSGLDTPQIDLLDRISREHKLTGGSRDDWLSIIELARGKAYGADEDEVLTQLTGAQADALAEGLDAFMTAVTPPTIAPTRDYVAWLDGLLGEAPRSEVTAADNDDNNGEFSLRVRQLARSDESPQSRRDSRALAGLDAILRGMRAADNVQRLTGGAEAIEWAQFYGDLAHALEAPLLRNRDRSRRGKVLVTTADEALGLPHAHVFILGLAEGVFPAEMREDPLCLDSERRTWRARGIPLDSRVDRGDEQSLFYELLALPQESLTLSRPTFKDGKPWQASHFWGAVKRVYPQQPIESAGLGAVVMPEYAASEGELMLALASWLSDGESRKPASALRHLAWLRAEMPGTWRRVQLGRAVERGRLSNQPFDNYSGVLSQPHLLAEVARKLGPKRVFSASQLNDYGVCGFRYFAKRLLKLEEFEEPELGADALQLGSLNHAILQHTYEQIAEQGSPINEANRDAALVIFAEVADELLEHAPRAFNFRATAAWQEEKQLIKARLAALIRQDFSAKSPLAKKDGGPRHVQELEREFDNLEIALSGMESLRVRGLIDRIDRVDGKLVVVDYKTGSKRIPESDLTAGRNVQMLVYLAALQQLTREDDVAGGLYWHLGSLQASGRIQLEDDEDQAALQSASQTIARNLQQGRSGAFPVHATSIENGKCVRYCEFARLCRRNNTSRYKATGH